MKYIEPKMEVVVVAAEDVITASDTVLPDIDI